MKKKGLPKAVSIFYFILSVFISPSLTLAKGLSLNELVEFALKNSPSYKNTINSLSISEMQKSNAFSTSLPSLDIQTVQGYQDSEPVETESELSSELKLSLSAKLYDNGSNFINHDRFKKQHLKRVIELKRDRAKLCLGISNEYYNYLLSSQVLKIQISQYQLLQKQFQSIQSLYRQGRKKRIDFVRFKARLQRANLSKKQALITQSKSLEELKEMLAWGDSPLIIGTVENKNLNLQDWPLKPPQLNNHYESKIANYDREINDFSIDLQKRKYLPEVYFDAGASYTNADYLSDSDSFRDDRQTDVSALLTVKFNLWDWGIRRRHLSISRLEVANLNNGISEKLLSVRAQINKLMLNIAQEKENYELNKELMGLEKKNFNSINTSYKEGQTTFLDLINSLDNFTAAQESYYRNYYQLKNSIAEYYFHEGTLYEKINKYLIFFDLTFYCGIRVLLQGE